MAQPGNKSHIKRIFAVIALILTVLCLIGLILSAFIGDDPRITLLFLFFIIVIPAVAYAFSAFIRLTVKPWQDQGPDNDPDPDTDRD